MPDTRVVACIERGEVQTHRVCAECYAKLGGLSVRDWTGRPVANPEPCRCDPPCIVCQPHPESGRVSSPNEDARLTRARECVEAASRYPDPAWHAMNDLLAFAKERLRVNVGLVMENGELRKQAREHRYGGAEDA